MSSDLLPSQLKRTLFIYSLANLFQGIATLVIFLQEKSAEAIVLGMSRERFFTFLGICLGLGVFGLLSAASLRKHVFFLEKIDRALKKYYVGWLAAAIAFLIVLWFGFIILQSLYPIYLAKIWFVLVWGALMGLESCLMLINLPESYKKSQAQWAQKYHPLIGYSLIAVAGVIGFLLRYYNKFGDEADHIATGRLMAQGWILYTDIFSHHSPLPYHWIAGVIRIFGADLGMIRFSLVILWVIVFSITAHLTRRYLAFGILAITWAGTSCFYLANLLNYQPFSGIFLVASMAMILYLDEIACNRWYFIWLGAMLVLTVLSNLMMVWPIAILGICFLAVLFRQKGISRQQAIMGLAITAASGMGVLFLFLIPMFFNHSLAAAIDGIITFNTEIYYGKYTNRTANQLPNIWNQMLHGLNSIALIKSGVFKFWNVLDQISGIAWNIDYWIMGGIAFRLSIMTMTILLLIAKKTIRALTIYAIAAATNVVEVVNGFHNTPFIVFALFIMATLISQDWLLQPRSPPKLFSKGTAIYNLGVRLIWLIVIVTLCSNVYAYLIERREMINYEYTFSDSADLAERLRRWECGNSSTKYLVYPLNPIIYFFLDRQPASKYMFMTPWVADVGQQELIKDILAESYVVIYLRSDASVWGYPCKDYLSDFLVVLEKDYIQTEPNIWVSPALYSQCSSN